MAQKTGALIFDETADRYDIFVLTFGCCVGKLPPYFMGGLIVYLSRLKGLYQVVG